MSDFLRFAAVSVSGLFALVALLGGCQPQVQPPPPSIQNTQQNEITEREGLVDTFQTTEVVGIPMNSHEFMVRDTNGVIWYVSTRDGDRKGRTRIFGWHEQFPEPAVPPMVVITNFTTNIVTITNVVVEDPVKGNP